MPLIIKFLAFIFLLLAVAIIAVAAVDYCQATADRLDSEEIERRAQKMAENARVTIRQEIVLIDETKEGLLNAEV